MTNGNNTTYQTQHITPPCHFWTTFYYPDGVYISSAHSRSAMRSILDHLVLRDLESLDNNRIVKHFKRGGVIVWVHNRTFLSKQA